MSTGGGYCHNKGRNDEFCITVDAVTRTAGILDRSVKGTAGLCNSLIGFNSHIFISCVYICGYKGQWLNSMYNGEGRLTEVSGTSYEGLWINGWPAYRAVKLVIIAALDNGGSSSLTITQGQSFAISVECQTDTGELMQGMSCAPQHLIYKY